MHSTFRWILVVSMLCVGAAWGEASAATVEVDLGPIFLNFENANAFANHGEHYSSWGVTFTADGETGGVDFVGEAPPLPIEYMGYPISPKPGQYVAGLDAMNFTRPIRAAVFTVKADAAGVIAISADGQQVTQITATEAGWSGPILVVGDGAIEEISFSGEAFGGVNNLMMYKDFLPGDSDQDGDVDINDFLVLKQHYGATAPQLAPLGDLDGDGSINIDDYIIARQQGIFYMGRLLIEAGDFNADNIVDVQDFVILKKFYGQTID